jgi:ABC-type Fe3+/spermidine/putrescine transport system ATPase subunit
MASSAGAVKATPWNDPAARPYIQVDRVSKSFGDFKAVNDVSLKIYKGEIFCLLGASGCGKTTLLRMLGGFETPSSGRIFIDGEDMTGVPPYERPVNMMFQSYALFPHMTVGENVAFGLKQDRMPKPEIAERVATMFVVVTHDQEEAMTLASRIGVMDHGEIVQAGTPSEIYEFPSSKFVADFVGSVNIFEGRLIEDEPEHVRIASDELGGTIYVSHGISAAPAAIVWAAVRPEKVFMSTVRPEGEDNVARGAVQDIAYLGDLSIYLVKLPTGKVIRVTQPNTSRHAETITWDQEVYLSWDPSSPVVVTR